MKLYHGTSSRHLEGILKRGIKPRGNRRSGNWEHSVTSSPKHVYLTSGYAMHYACSSQKGDGYSGNREQLLLLEVDTNRIVPWRMFADEDFLYQAMQRNFPGPSKHKDMKARTAWFRDHLDAFQGAWEDSVRMMGTCCVEGVVTPASITRYALVPRTHALRFQSDPVVGIANHAIMGHFYRSLTAHVFGDSLAGIKPELPMQELQLSAVERMSKLPREGITVVDLTTQERKAG